MVLNNVTKFHKIGSKLFKLESRRRLFDVRTNGCTDGQTGVKHDAGLQIRVRTEKLLVLFFNQNICCGYSKEPSQ